MCEGNCTRIVEAWCHQELELPSKLVGLTLLRVHFGIHVEVINEVRLFLWGQWDMGQFVEERKPEVIKIVRIA
jgi:hypothetical protein